MSEINLLPCPICGGEASLTKKNRIIVEGKTERECHVHCNKCNARAERVLYKSCSTTEMAHELARKLWNTRKPMERIIERLEKIQIGRTEEGVIVGCNIGVCEDDDCILCLKKKIIEIVKEECGINE